MRNISFINVDVKRKCTVLVYFKVQLQFTSSNSFCSTLPTSKAVDISQTFAVEWETNIVKTKPTIIWYDEYFIFNILLIVLDRVNRIYSF